MSEPKDGSWIDARTLHKELKVGKVFANWIKDRIHKYEFVENEDFKLDLPNLANQKSHGGDRKTKYYSLTLDMAKELSMVENNKIGRISVNTSLLLIRHFFLWVLLSKILTSENCNLVNTQIQEFMIMKKI